MTKSQLQKELLEKVKPGTKPSDIKRTSKKQPKKSVLPSPIVQSDEGYSSEELDQERKNEKTSNQTLTQQIQALQKQLDLYKDFKEADLKIKEKLKQENQSLKKTISDLQKAKPTGEVQPEVKTFLCSDCQQDKPHPELSRVFGKYSFCLECSRKARKQAQQEKNPEPQPTDFRCHSCQQTKTEPPFKMKLDQTFQSYQICSSCRPNLKEFNEADLITDELWEKYPYASASEILEKEFNLKKEEAW